MKSVATPVCVRAHFDERRGSEIRSPQWWVRIPSLSDFLVDGNQFT